MNLFIKWLLINILIPAFPLLFTIVRHYGTSYNSPAMSDMNILCSFILSICFGVLAVALVALPSPSYGDESNQIISSMLGVLVTVTLIFYVLNETSPLVGQWPIFISILFPIAACLLSIISFVRQSVYTK